MWNSCVLTIAFAAPVSSSDSAFNRAEDVFDTGILGGAYRSGCLLATSSVPSSQKLVTLSVIY
jgi:hypothetical protein